MAEYKEVIEELKSRGIRPLEGEFYDYEGFPLEDEFAEFF